MRDRGSQGKAPQESCAACRVVAEAQRTYTHVLLTSLKHDEGVASYRPSFGPCMAHFFRAFAAAARDTRALLKEGH